MDSILFILIEPSGMDSSAAEHTKEQTEFAEKIMLKASKSKYEHFHMSSKILFNRRLSIQSNLPIFTS